MQRYIEREIEYFCRLIIIAASIKRNIPGSMLREHSLLLVYNPLLLCSIAPRSQALFSRVKAA